MADEDLDPADLDIVIQLMMRIGMIMEDQSPIALDAPRTGLRDRVLEVADASKRIAALAAAAVRFVTE